MLNHGPAAVQFAREALSMRNQLWLSCWVLVALALFPSAGAAQDKDLQDKINAAIDRGAAFLKSQFQKGVLDYGGAFGAGHQAGMTALGAWTLLETGVPARDPV